MDDQTAAHLLADMGNDFDRALGMLDEIRGYLGDDVYHEWKQWLKEAKELNQGS